MNRKTMILLSVMCAALLSGCADNNGAAAETGVYTEIVGETSVADETTASEETQSSESAVTDEVTETEISETEAAASVSCAEISAAIIEAVELPSMAEVGADRIAMYLDFEIPEGCDFSMYICGSGGFADEIFVINAENIDTDALEAAVEKRIEAHKKDFEGYNPDEYAKLEDYYSDMNGGYYIYTVTNDNDMCASIFDEFVK